jgi:hypothetical protein
VVNYGLAFFEVPEETPGISAEILSSPFTAHWSVVGIRSYAPLQNFLSLLHPHPSPLAGRAGLEARKMGARVRGTTPKRVAKARAESGCVDASAFGRGIAKVSRNSGSGLPN